VAIHDDIGRAERRNDSDASSDAPYRSDEKGVPGFDVTGCFAEEEIDIQTVLLVQPFGVRDDERQLAHAPARHADRERQAIAAVSTCRRTQRQPEGEDAEHAAAQSRFAHGPIVCRFDTR
jgi:hypothetical protein